MIIDIHGHYTTAPKALETWRHRQIAGIANPKAIPKASELRISDDELRESIEVNQLRLMREHGLDDTKRYIDAAHIEPQQRQKIFEGNARRVYPRLDAALKAKGR